MGAVRILSGNPNKQHNKQKCVISQETGWNPIYPLFKRFFWTFKLLYFHYFPTIEHNNWKSNPQSFWFLMNKEQYIKNSCIDLLNTQWIKRCFSVWIFQCHANNVQNRGLTFQEILIASWRHPYFQNTKVCAKRRSRRKKALEREYALFAQKVKKSKSQKVTFRAKSQKVTFRKKTQKVKKSLFAQKVKK